LLLPLILLFFIVSILNSIMVNGCKDDPSAPFPLSRNGNCGEIDSVKSASKGEISAYINPQHPDASYILQVNSQRYVGNTNENTQWAFFTGLPSGTYGCSWWVSGCPAEGEENQIPGPSEITIK
jgi:hypothetical protein